MAGGGDVEGAEVVELEEAGFADGGDDDIDLVAGGDFEGGYAGAGDAAGDDGVEGRGRCRWGMSAALAWARPREATAARRNERRKCAGTRNSFLKKVQQGDRTGGMFEVRGRTTTLSTSVNRLPVNGQRCTRLYNAGLPEFFWRTHGATIFEAGCGSHGGGGGAGAGVCGAAAGAGVYEGGIALRGV